MIINFLDVDGEFLAKEIFHDLPVEQGYVIDSDYSYSKIRFALSICYGLNLVFVLHWVRFVTSSMNFLMLTWISPVIILF